LQQLRQFGKFTADAMRQNLFASPRNRFLSFLELRFPAECGIPATLIINEE
jgi:hypothetical protein